MDVDSVTLELEKDTPDPLPPVQAKHSTIGDVLFGFFAKASAVITLLALAGIIISLFAGAWPAIKSSGLDFFKNAEWDPVSGVFGGFTMIYGTLMTSLIALLIAVPVSLGIAVFLSELAPVWLRRPLVTAIELLAAIPSIVYGMWGLMIFSPILSTYVQQPLQSFFENIPVLNLLFQGPPIGIGIFAAGIILAIMIIPFITSVMRDVFVVTPPMLKESAYGIGCTTWEVIRHVVLPYTKAGVIGGIMLGLGRAMGETMAVTFIIGNTSSFTGLSLFNPANTITSVLANEFAEATPDQLSALFYLGLVLFLITFIVLAASKTLLAHLTTKEGK